MEGFHFEFYLPFSWQFQFALSNYSIHRNIFSYVRERESVISWMGTKGHEVALDCLCCIKNVKVYVMSSGHHVDRNITVIMGI